MTALAHFAPGGCRVPRSGHRDEDGGGGTGSCSQRPDRFCRHWLQEATRCQCRLINTDTDVAHEF